MTIESNKLRLDPPDEDEIRVIISIKENGVVEWGSFSTEKGQFLANLKEGANLTLKANPEENFEFLHWKARFVKDGIFSFVSSKEQIIMERMNSSREILAVFGKLETLKSSDHA